MPEKIRVPKEEKKETADRQTERTTTPALDMQFIATAPPPLTPARVIALQRIAGNRAVSQLIQTSRAPAAEEGEEVVDEELAKGSGEPSAVEQEAIEAPMPDPVSGGEELEKEQTSPAAPLTGFVDRGQIGVARPWWDAPATQSPGRQGEMVPAAFNDQGRVRTERVWWSSSTGNSPPWGARGNAPTGSVQGVVNPVYKTSAPENGGTARGWIESGSGSLTISRGYIGVNAGDNGNYYLTTQAATRINVHEQGHTNQSRIAYDAHIAPFLNQKHSKENGVTGATEADAMTAIKAFWDTGKASATSSFATDDTARNRPLVGGTYGTWDTSEQATSDYYANYGSKKVGDKTYANYIDKKP